jgi:ribosomal protein S18 acetylase RimI-like enzyme
MQIVIRSFDRQDTEAIISLWHTCKLTRPWNNPRKDIQRKCAVNDELFLVATNADRVIGSVMGGYEGHRGWINYLAVHPDFRRQGIASQLMQKVESRLLALDCPKINLQIRLDNSEASAFYESLGFSDDQCISMGKRLISD